ncbi:MAG: phosphoribosyl-ATP diphosphatase [Thermoproteota archaeon]
MSSSSLFLEELFEVVKSRKSKYEESSYTSRLIASGLQKVISKFGEECSELIAAACGEGNVVGEAADVLFHMMVLLAAKDVDFSDVIKELQRRRK